jgi:hypothetical protein
MMCASFLSFPGESVRFSTYSSLLDVFWSRKFIAHKIFVSIKAMHLAYLNFISLFSGSNINL